MLFVSTLARRLRAVAIPAWKKKGDYQRANWWVDLSECGRVNSRERCRSCRQPELELGQQAEGQQPAKDQLAGDCAEGQSCAATLL